jgi:hypothetical protein
MLHGKAQFFDLSPEEKTGSETVPCAAEATRRTFQNDEATIGAFWKGVQVKRPFRR